MFYYNNDYRADFVIVNSQYPKNTREFYRAVLPGYERESLHYIAQIARKPAASVDKLFVLSSGGN
jgi:hypothetical protein